MDQVGTRVVGAEHLITEDTERIAADADLAVKSETVKFAAEARRFDGLQLPEDVARKLNLLGFRWIFQPRTIRRRRRSWPDRRFAARRLWKREMVSGRGRSSKVPGS